MRKAKDAKEQIKEDKREVKELKKAVSAALFDAEKLLKVKDIDACIPEYQTMLDVLEQCESLVGVYACLEKVIAYNEKMYQKVQDKISELNVEIRGKEETKTELEHQIRELEAKRLIYPAAVTRLQMAIREQLRKLNRAGETRILCELLEQELQRLAAQTAELAELAAQLRGEFSFCEKEYLRQTSRCNSKSDLHQKFQFWSTAK